MSESKTQKETQEKPLRPLLDVNETAETLHISVRYVRALLARGDLPVVRLGRRTLVRRADLEAVIARGGFAGAA
jgi:excisionase family DNA binding protein